ncbi:hypothetical protein BC830DRAFT_867248 [Chytriomyces sp. MP71]|nr:hypothetical protein BC830DRAFT_867248 [Chytriomyces sp. MP71]
MCPSCYPPSLKVMCSMPSQASIHHSKATMNLTPVPPLSDKPMSLRPSVWQSFTTIISEICSNRREETLTCRESKSCTPLLQLFQVVLNLTSTLAVGQISPFEKRIKGHNPNRSISIITLEYSASGKKNAQSLSLYKSLGPSLFLSRTRPNISQIPPSFEVSNPGSS